ncbi:hypothetical protein [Alkalicoccobacillus murimartini]|uniref:Relaxase/mobilization nuclease domain-containing protein n=1 Tax=Alkalicoccobacillus murimartini TaxID=171685 RepID=A0ABT9YLS5_9BACI|nr:hypothetical protein [Alkalicoccobacillus murimartini]MDQ0208691.1 hypothetical protein [Alkalicoccobacillus murimartini]
MIKIQHIPFVNNSVHPLKNLINHLTYLEKSHPDQKPFFNKDADNLTKTCFTRALNKQKVKGNESGYKLLITSDLNQMKQSSISLIDIIRNGIISFEHSQQIHLDWLALNHASDHMPHTHLVIRGFDVNQNKVNLSPSHWKIMQHCITKQLDDLTTHS